MVSITIKVNEVWTYINQKFNVFDSIHWLINMKKLQDSLSAGILSFDLLLFRFAM